MVREDFLEAAKYPNDLHIVVGEAGDGAPGKWISTISLAAANNYKSLASQEEEKELASSREEVVAGVCAFLLDAAVEAHYRTFYPKTVEEFIAHLREKGCFTEDHFSDHSIHRAFEHLNEVDADDGQGGPLQAAPLLNGMMVDEIMARLDKESCVDTSHEPLECYPELVVT